MSQNGIYTAVKNGYVFLSKTILSILVNYTKKQKEKSVNYKKLTLIKEYVDGRKKNLKPTIEKTCINKSKNSMNFMRTHNASSSHSFYLRRPSSKSSAERRLT